MGSSLGNHVHFLPSLRLIAPLFLSIRNDSVPGEGLKLNARLSLHILFAERMLNHGHFRHQIRLLN